MKFKYIVEHYEEPVNEGLLSWVKSKLRDPRDYYKANKSALQGFTPVWIEKWNSPNAGKCEGVRFTHYMGYSIRVCFADMGGDMTEITSIDYYEYKDTPINIPDYTCVFDKPVIFGKVWPVIERYFKEGKTEMGTLRVCNNAMFKIKNGSPDKINSVVGVYSEFMNYWHSIGDKFSDENTMIAAVIDFYKKFLGVKLSLSDVSKYIHKFGAWTDYIIGEIIIKCELLKSGCVKGNDLLAASAKLTFGG